MYERLRPSKRRKHNTHPKVRVSNIKAYWHGDALIISRVSSQTAVIADTKWDIEIHKPDVKRFPNPDLAKRTAHSIAVTKFRKLEKWKSTSC